MYSPTVLRAMLQLRAIFRVLKPASKCNRSTSLTLRMDNPFLGISLPSSGFSLMVKSLSGFIQRRFFANPFSVFHFGLFRPPISLTAKKWPV